MSKKLVLGVSGIFVGLMLASAPNATQGYKYHPKQRVAEDACKKEIRHEIWSDKPRVQEIYFIEPSIESHRITDAKIDVRGRGEMFSMNRTWVRFNFDCIYNHYNNRVSSADYRSSAPQSTKPNPRAGHLAETKNACERRIDSQILKDHPSATRINYDEQSVRYWRESGSEDGLHGFGRFIGGRGAARHYEYRCVYNHRQNYIRNAWVSVR